MGLFHAQTTMTERHIVVLTLDIDPSSLRRNPLPQDWDWRQLLRLSREEDVEAVSYVSDGWLDIRLHITDQGPEEV